MKHLVYITLIFSSLNAFAVSFHQESSDRVDEVLSSLTIDTERTCVDEYNQRRKQLLKLLIVTPPVGVAAVPASAITFAVGAAVVAKVIGVAGWDALGMFAGGLLLGGVGAGAAAITGEAILVDQYVKIVRMMNLLIESKTRILGKSTLRFHKRLKKKLPGFDLEPREFQRLVRELDEQEDFCDNTIRRHRTGKRPRQRLAKYRHFKKYLAQTAY